MRRGMGKRGFGELGLERGWEDGLRETTDSPQEIQMSSFSEMLIFEVLVGHSVPPPNKRVANMGLKCRRNRKLKLWELSAYKLW